MSSICEDIKTILTGNGYVFGVDLFINSLPVQPVDVVTLYDTSSTPPDGTLDGNNVYERGNFQVIIRNTSYTAAHVTAGTLRGLLHNRGNETINSNYYVYVRMVNGANAIVLEGDVKHSRLGGILLTMNFETMRKV